MMQHLESKWQHIAVAVAVAVVAVVDAFAFIHHSL